MTILILHGIEGYAGNHWQQWLHDKLVAKNHIVIMPSLPKADHPNRSTLLKKINKVVGSSKLAELVIVGHSLGVPASLDFIEQADKPIKALISVSGFSEDYGAEMNSYFLEKRTIDFKKVNKKLSKAFVVFGDDDPYVPQSQLKLLAKKLKVKPKIIKKGGHLNTDSGYTTFPWLFEIIENLS